MTAKTVESVLVAKGREVRTSWVWSSVAEASQLLAGPPRIGALVVLDEQRHIGGLLTERDLARGVQQHGAALPDLAVEQVMSSAVPTCVPSDDLASVMRTMTDWRFRHLPVVRHGEPVGVVSIGDVVRALLQEAQLETAVLRDVVISRS